MVRLWIWIFALATAVKGLKINDVDPKSQSVPPGGNVVLTVIWEAESDDEKKGQISVGLHLNGKPPLEGVVLPTPVSPSPSKVTFSNVAAGNYQVYAVENSWPPGRPASFQDTIEIKVQENDPPAQSQLPLTEQQTTGAGPTSSHDGGPGTQPTPTSTAKSDPRIAMTQSSIDSENTSSSIEPQNIHTDGTGSTSTPTTHQSITSSRASISIPAGPRSGNDVETQSSVNPTNPQPSSNENTRNQRGTIGPIIGGVIGGLAFIIIATLVVICLRRRRSKQSKVTEPFDKNKMIIDSNQSKFEYPFAAEFNPAYAAPKQFTEDITTLYTSRASSPVDTDAITVTGTEVTGKPRQFARTDRQMEIEERVQQLQAQLIALHNQSKFQKSQGEERQIEEIREKIERLNALKSGYWALEQSDERPREMMY